MYIVLLISKIVYYSYICIGYIILFTEIHYYKYTLLNSAKVTLVAFFSVEVSERNLQKTLFILR